MEAGGGLIVKTTDGYLTSQPQQLIMLFTLWSSDGSGSGQVNFLWLRSGQISHLWLHFGFGKFPLKMSNFSFFIPSGQKNLSRSKAGQPLFYCGSKVSSGRVRAHLYCGVLVLLALKGALENLTIFKY